MLIHLICAARPNFMKVAPLYHALKNERWATVVIVHTGQHYDANMSDAFFDDLNLPKPHVYLGIGSGSHAEQVARVMIEYEKVILDQKPDLIIVVGDVNSTMAVTLAASKIEFAGRQTNGQRRPVIAHLEAGLRSYDRGMPEEINRLVTDVLADTLWTPSIDANENLAREGISPNKVRLVGNIMIDSLEMLRAKIEAEQTYQRFNLAPKSYGVATFHRPSNVDDSATLTALCNTLKDISNDVPLIFPVHPRTRKNMQQNGNWSEMESANIFLPEPLGYAQFMNLVFNSRFVLTDSGGIQEETTYLGIPCLTVRDNTERPITITKGTNQLCTLDDLMIKTKALLHDDCRSRPVIDYWDGKTAQRIVKIIDKEIRQGVAVS